MNFFFFLIKKKIRNKIRICCNNQNFFKSQINYNIKKKKTLNKPNSINFN